MIEILSKITLGPVLLAQGLYTRWVTPRLPEPVGERAGVSGIGPRLRLLILGDSAAAGVGVTSQDDALAGKLVARLSGDFAVSWRLLAQSGLDTREVVQLLERSAAERFDANTPTLIVDFAGNSELLGRLHGIFGQQLQYSCLVGAAHWDQRGGLPSDLPGPTPKLFFAPAQAEKRLKEWGGEYFQRCLIEHWQAFRSGVGQWLNVEAGCGYGVVEQVYGAVLKGQASPQVGYILSLSTEQNRVP